ncbi:MAG: hypothetical protein IPM64_17830 [Phycisphaerales bacterium]|nr:hypothetical protein [Phycisphaerales bacterium]
MTHAPIAIESSDLYNRLSENDNNIAESADWIGAGDIFDSDGNFDQKLQGTWYVVTWPQHVVAARYNGDCSCSGPFASREEAVAHEPAARVYGE